VNKFIQRRWLPRKIAQKYSDILLLLYRFHIFASDQIKEERNKKSFCFLWQLSLQKATFDFFGATFEQLFEKFLETFWEISSNLWQALVPVIVKL